MGKKTKSRSDGRKEARYLVPPEYRSVVGRTYVSFYGRTEKEAKAKRTAYERDLIRNGARNFDANRVTFGQWLERWIDSLPNLVAEGTASFYEYRCRAYLIPALGNVRLNALNAEHLDGLYRDLSRGKGTPSGKPLAPATIGHVHSTARRALQRAVKKRMIPYNPARDAEPPKIDKKRRTTLTLGGLQDFFKAANGERLEALWIVWCLTGLRPGEILGLKWEDVRLSDDASGGEILIRRSWSAMQTGAYMRDTTKTNRERPVALLPEAVAALKIHRVRYAEELVRRRESWNAAWEKFPKHRDLVFPSTAGTAIDHTNLNRQHFKPILRRAGLPDMRPYDLRHSFATLWIESGESGEALQKILGHSSIATTINVYPQLSTRYLRESFGRFGDSLRSGDVSQGSES